MLVEGPGGTIGQLLPGLYDDRAIHRSRWSVDHTMRSRRACAEHLRRSGLAGRRQGIAVKDPAMVDVLQARCARLGLACHSSGKSR